MASSSDGVLRSPQVEAADALRLAGSLEARTAHPLAAAVVNEAVGGCVDGAADNALSDDVKKVTVTAGSGVAGLVAGREVEAGTAQHVGLDEEAPDWAPPFRGGATTLFVAVDGEVRIALSVFDPLRDDAPAALNALRALGLKLAVLTGDKLAVVNGVLADFARKGCDLGDLDVRASCKPEDKLAYVRDAQGRKAVVLFVGDGINDAPALAAADVGAAMGAGGAALAVDAADVAVLDDRLGALPEACTLGRLAVTLIRQNVALSVVLKVAVVAAAASGVDVPLAVAVLADLASLLLVVANGSRPMWA